MLRFWTASPSASSKKGGDPIYDGWFCFGGTEIINNARAVGYAQSAGQIRNLDHGSDAQWTDHPNYCDITWFQDAKDRECLGRLAVALGEVQPYQAQYIPDQAPWYSRYSGYSYPADPSRKFLGVYGLSVSALSDSTRTLDITEGILSGGVLGRERLAVPRFRFRVALTAVDEEGLEYGISWLSKALSEQSCSTHGPSCGSSDLTFFSMCPTFERDPNGPIQAYEEKIDSISRMYHDVKCIAGPVVTDRYNRGENSWGAVVEFDLAAGVPNMFGIAPPWVPISQDGEVIVQDIPLNEILYPSAEIAGADVTVATNYSTNPSVETNATGWTSGRGGGITAPMVTSSRVTGELAAVGTSSFRAVFTATATGTSGSFFVYQDVTIPLNATVSISMWAAEVLMAGTIGTRNPITISYAWYDAGNVQIGNGLVGTIPVNGGAASARSLTPPAGAVKVRVTAGASIQNWSATAVLRLYADALAVTIP